MSNQKQQKVKLFELRSGVSQKSGEEYEFLQPNVGDSRFNVKSITVELQDGTLVELNKQTPLYINDVREKNRKFAATEAEAEALNAKIPDFILCEAVLTVK